MGMINCAVIGVGYLGKFHAEKYANLPQAKLVAVCDIDQQKCDAIATQHQANSVADFRQLVGEVDAVSIAATTTQHFEIAKFCLSQGIHVLVEKPMTTTVEEADQLIALSKANNCILQVGHLERFNPVLSVLDGVLDNPRFIESTRLAPFNPRGTDVNVVLDLMIHDIDIIQSIIGAKIDQILAVGSPVLSQYNDIVNARIQFTNGCIANVTASRVSLKKERKLRFFQHNAYVSIDLQNKKVAIYRKGEGEMFAGIPEIISETKTLDQGDALRDEIISFLEAITHNRPPVVSGEEGKRALATALEITRIVKQELTKAPLFATPA